MLPERLRPLLLDEPRLDPALRWDELLELITAVVEQVLDESESERALRFLEQNLPGSRLRELLDWPGEWFGNRWLEEVVLGPEQIAFYALARSGRRLPDVPGEPELPFPVPGG